MASSVKFMLRNKPNKEGLFPLVIRITKDRKSTFLYTGYYLEKKYWDEKNNRVKKSYPNSARLNNLLVAKLAQANKTLIDLETEENSISSKQIKEEIVNPISHKSFNELSAVYLKELEDNDKWSRLIADKSRVKHVITYAKTDSLRFQSINEEFLKGFMTYLKNDLKNSPRTIINNLITIRTLFNRAIKMGIVERKYYPFGSDKIQIKFPETEKIGLTVDEVIKIQELDNLTQYEIHARNAWLFSFFLAGMRVGDVIKIRWSDIYDGRLHYRMNKNDKLLSLKLPEKLTSILDYYRLEQLDENDFIFPEMKLANLESPKDVLAKTKAANKKFNKYLKSIAEKAEIDKKLTMHIARHTFGNISGDKISVQTLQKLYRHSNITTTILYQSNFKHKDFDDALDNVLDF